MAMGKAASPMTSMVYSFFLFLVTLSAQQVSAQRLASTEWFTILGGFISSLLFLFGLTFLGNFQEYIGLRTGWGAVLLAEFVAVGAAAFVHRVCCTTCILFSIGILYEMNKLSTTVHQQSETKKKAH